MKKALNVVCVVAAGFILYEYGKYVESTKRKAPRKMMKQAADSMYCHACDAEEEVVDAIEHLEGAIHSIQNIVSIWNERIKESNHKKGADRNGETAGSSE